MVDRELNIVAWNSQYLELFEYPAGMVKVGTPVAELIRYNAERDAINARRGDSHKLGLARMLSQ